ncbi:hypothetical protein Barb7_00027 [Bacteroidales bacterium Barb7]|nr:hypothetical protein Barb7_00076 [Bacteroidales bacterium Barb7]OAV76313.1 hypothetical protein Barb7_00027 [Bacteroidales bacterium Barb7]
MIVICRYNTGICFPDDFLPLGGWDSKTEFSGLTVDSLYIVYGTTVIKGYECFLICKDGYHYENYPTFLPCQLFETVNNIPSKYWVEREATDEYTGKKMIERGFQPLLDEEYFFWNLLEDCEREKKLFSEYKRRVDKEIIEFLRKK